MRHGIALRWEWIAVGYCAYLCTIAFLFSRFARARVPVLLAAVVCLVGFALSSTIPPAAVTGGSASWLVLPASVLLIGYWLSGLFFLAPMPSIERTLLAADQRFLVRSGLLARYQDGPRVVRESLELAYLIVYLVVPAGAVALSLGGRLDSIPRFWTVVLLSEFLCYGALPWIQTRSPRVLEDSGGTKPTSLVRTLNLAVLSRGSIQANTVPSGHAAGAVATALVVVEVMPSVGLAFLVLAGMIVAATVFGRYHYLIDSFLGVAVAVAVWTIVV